MKKKIFMLCLLLAFGLLPGLVWADEAVADDAAQQEQPADTAAENQTDNEPADAEEKPAENPEENVADNEATDDDEAAAGNEETNPEEQPEENPAEPPVSNLADPTLNQVKLTLDSKWALVRGQSQQIEAAPITINDTTMLPLRFIAQDILDAQVNWNAETKQVTVLRGQMSLLVDLEGGQVLVDEQPYAMAVLPTVIDGRTYVPLRLVTELMDCQVQYNPEDHSILITLPLDVEPEPPVADITYRPATAGQTIEYYDYSYDPQGRQITAREWTVTDSQGQSKTGESLYWLFYQKQGGDYVISYRVKNALGLWSEPVVVDFRLEENRPPEITRLSALQTEVAVGQRLDISYLYDNEEWEDLTSISFSYSWENEQGNKVTKLGKPAAFFQLGDRKSTRLNSSH